MSVLKALRDTVAPELNHLYTTPPTEGPDGLDCGWHGREHALHAFLVARMFGASADIRSGDFAVLSPYLPPITSIERPTVDHTWCSVNGVAPVDLSLTLAFLGQAPQLRTAVIGEGRNGEWAVQYRDDESVLDESFGHTNEIIYIERKLHSESESALLADPFLLLSAAKPEDPANPVSKYGPDIFGQVTLHCHACANRTAKSIRQRLDREQAFAWIAEQYPSARDKILEILRAANASGS